MNKGEKNIKTRKSLLIIFGVTIFSFLFFISFASATITVSVNATRPIFNLELVEDDGTELLDVDTNYYFQCVITGYGYRGSSSSPASEEFNVTTNSTHRWLNLSNMKNMCDNYTINDNGKGVMCRVSRNVSFKSWGGDGYMPWNFNDNDTGGGHYGWTAQYANPGVYWQSDFKCSSNKDSLLVKNNDANAGTICYSSLCASRYFNHPEISIPLTNRDQLEISWNVSLGIADIYMDGTNTWDDLITAIQGSPAKNIASVSQNSLSIIGQIYGTGTLTFTKKSVTLVSGDNDNANLNFVNSQLLIDKWGQNWHETFGSFNDTSLVSFASGDILDSTTFAKGLIYCGSYQGTHYQPYDGWTFNCLTGFHQTRYVSNGFTFYNSVWNGVYDYNVPGADNGTAYYENCTFNNNGIKNYDILVYLGYLDDCLYPNHHQDFSMKNVVSDRADKRLVIYYNLFGDMCDYTMNLTFHGDNKFTIIDEDGNIISGANVTLSNEFNTYTNTTNANGIVIHDANFYKKYINQSMTLNHYALTQELGTYNLTITKANYEDYSTIITLSEPQDWTIALLDEVPYFTGNITTLSCFGYSLIPCYDQDFSAYNAYFGYM